MRLLRRVGLSARGIDFSNSHLWRLEQQGRFPRRVRLGNGRVAWIEHEIDEYLEGLAAARAVTGSQEAGREQPSGLGQTLGG
jgi:predicted DNA-binding transcriptional regulator AlpA